MTELVESESFAIASHRDTKSSGYIISVTLELNVRTNMSGKWCSIQLVHILFLHTLVHGWYTTLVVHQSGSHWRYTRVVHTGVTPEWFPSGKTSVLMCWCGDGDWRQVHTFQFSARKQFDKMEISTSFDMAAATTCYSGTPFSSSCIYHFGCTYFFPHLTSYHSITGSLTAYAFSFDLKVSRL